MGFKKTEQFIFFGCYLFLYLMFILYNCFFLCVNYFRDVPSNILFVNKIKKHSVE